MLVNLLMNSHEYVKLLESLICGLLAARDIFSSQLDSQLKLFFSSRTCQHISNSISEDVAYQGPLYSGSMC
jgi:hypothetical protein